MDPIEPVDVGTASLATLDDVAREFRSLAGKPLLVNIWATWCEPCVEEFPDLVGFHRNFSPRGVGLLSLSVDLPDTVDSRVQPFLEKQAAPHDTLVLDAVQPEALADLLGVNASGWDGALPATFLFDETGAMQEVWFTSVSYEELAAAAEDVLSGKSYCREAHQD